jgi:hypothetical protein
MIKSCCTSTSVSIVTAQVNKEITMDNSENNELKLTKTVGTSDRGSEFYTDSNDNPTGGKSWGVGYEINWQNGIVKGGKNGAFLEEVIEDCIARLEFFNESKFRCRENSLAITKLEEALQWLNYRTSKRSKQGVENSYETHKD